MAVRKGLTFLEDLTDIEQEAHNTVEGLFETLDSKLRSQDNDTISLLHHCKSKMT